MSIRLRLLLVLCLLLIAFGGALLQLRRAEHDHIARIIEGVRDDGRMQLARWSNLSGLSLRQFVRDHAQWQETSTFLENPDPLWASRHLDENLAVYGLDAIWLIRPDGTPAHTTSKDPAASLPVLPAAVDLAKAAQKSGLFDFFAESSQ